MKKWKASELKEMAQIVNSSNTMEDALEGLQIKSYTLSTWCYRFPSSEFALSVKQLRERIRESTQESKATNVLHMRISNKLKRTLAEEAKKRNMAISELVKASIDAYLKA